MDPQLDKLSDNGGSFALRPKAVTIRKAQEVLGDKARSQVYEAVGRGELDAVKDGNKTLITVESIERYMAAWPRAKIKPSTPRQPREAAEHTKPKAARRTRRGNGG
jgi:hypothetical protein